MAPTDPQPESNARVRMLETIEPTATDRTRYDYDSVWTVSLARAEALEAAGAAEILEIIDPAPAAPADAPADVENDVASDEE
jgi:hypothetical protein